MYSYEQRLRAVELYIQPGKRVGATMRQLGYPTKNSLKGWYREYQRQIDLPRGYVRSKRKGQCSSVYYLFTFPPQVRRTPAAKLPGEFMLRA
jgi:transposase-like protein